MASLLVALVLAASLFVAPAIEAAQSCEELVRYRNTELLRAWEVALERQRIFEEAKADAKKFAQDLLRETELERSNLMLYRAVLAQDIKTFANAVGNVLDIVANTGTAKKAAAIAARQGEKAFGKLSPETAEAMLRGNDTAQRITDGGLLYAFTVEWGADAVPVIGPALKAIWDYANDLADREKLIQAHAEHRQIVYERVSAFIRAIDQAKDQIRRSNLAQAQIRAVKDGIDLYCSRSASIAPDSRFAGRWSIQWRVEFEGETVQCRGIAVVRATSQPNEYVSDEEIQCLRRIHPGWVPARGLRDKWTVKSRDRWTIDGDKVLMREITSDGGREMIPGEADASIYDIANNDTLRRTWTHRTDTGAFGSNVRTYSKQ